MLAPGLLVIITGAPGTGKTALARHPGFVENEQIENFAAVHLNGTDSPLSIGENLHKLDTTEFATLDLDALFGALRAATTYASQDFKND